MTAKAQVSRQGVRVWRVLQIGLFGIAVALALTRAAGAAPACTMRDGSAGALLQLDCFDLSAETVSILGEELPEVAAFERLKRLTVERASEGTVDLSPLAGLPDLERIYGAQLIAADLTPLVALSRLSWLGIGVAGADLSPLSRIDSLRELALTGYEPMDLAPLSGLPNLKALRLFAHAGVDARGLRDLPELRTLEIGGDVSLGFLEEVPNLFRIALRGGAIDGIEAVCALPALEELVLDRIRTRSLDGLAGCQRLTILHMTKMGARDISVLSRLGALRMVTLDGTSPKSLVPLRALTGLKTLSLKGVRADLAPLRDMPSLSRVIFPDGTVVDGWDNILLRLSD